MRTPTISETVETGASRLLAALFAVLLALALVPLLAGGARAEGFSPTPPGIILDSSDDLIPSVRFAGEDRFETARLIAVDETPFAAEYSGEAVLVARADIFPDALAGSGLAGVLDAPIVLTPNDTDADAGALNDDLEGVLDFYLDQGDLDDVYILGSTAAIAQDVEDAIEAKVGGDATVTRVGGQNRFETAQLIADEMKDRGADFDQAIVANGGDFPDALVAGSIASNAELPILLTGSSGPLDPFAEQVLAADVDKAFIAGGPAAVSDEETEDDIDAVTDEVERVAGVDRFETAVEFAKLANSDFGFSNNHLNFARASQFPDALALGPHSGLDFNGPSPILLAEVDDYSEQTRSYVEDELEPCVEAIHVAGGSAAINLDVEDEIRESATREGDVCFLNLTPETATNLVGETHTVTASVTDNLGGEPTGRDETLTVTFEVETATAGGAETGTVLVVPESATAEIGPDESSASFTFTSYQPGTVTITATTTTEDGRTLTDTATKTFALPPPASEETRTAEVLDIATDRGTSLVTETTTVIESGGSTATGTPITGAQPGMVGIDYRPADGLLYGLSATGDLYTIDPSTGAATLVGATGISPSELATGGVGVDFNPQVDKLRVVTEDDGNYVVDPDTGAQVMGSPFADVAYAAGDENDGEDPAATGIAYTNSVFGETISQTREYAIDTNTDVLAVKDKNAGTLYTVGDLGVDATEVNGFDISPDTGFGYAVLTVGTDTSLYLIDLFSGEATDLGDLPASVTTTDGLAIRSTADDSDFLALSSAEEVPPVSFTANGFGQLAFYQATDTVCYQLRITDLGGSGNGFAAAAGTHVHAGVDGVAGPIVIPLETLDEATQFAQGCVVVDGDAATAIDDVVASPTAFYVNIHTTDSPTGLVRAQQG